MLEICERPGRLEHVVNDRCAGRCGGHFIEDGLERLVFDDDEVGRFLGDVRIGGQHDGNRFADVAHLLERKNRLIVESRSVIRVGDQLHDVFGGDDRVNACERQCGGDVDAHDASVRDRAAVNLAMQHARKLQIADIFDAAVHLSGAFEAWH
jgi:hypothetical protein